MPLVSVIVPCYNYGQFLTECLNSLLAQSLKNWECILVDNGSTDNTNKVCRDFVASDKRFVLIETENNGPSAARNCGIRIAKGKYIQFLDADDLLQCDKLLHQTEYLEKNPETDLVYSDVRFFDDKNPGILRTSLKGNKSDDWLPHISGENGVVLKYLRSYNFIVTHSPLLRKSLIDKIGGFDEKMATLEDWDFWLRCAFSGSFFNYHFKGDDFALVRVHENSLSKKKELMLSGNFTLLEKHILEKSTGLRHRIYFIFKYIVLFWDTFFSTNKHSNISVLMLILCMLLFPFWIFIKITRIISFER